MFYRISIFIFIFFFFLNTYSFFIDNPRELILATNSKPCSIPIFYLKEIGALKKLNIKLIHTTSDNESSTLFEIGNAEMITGTQHEYNYLKESTKDILPVILINRSNGRDMILSNKRLSQLKDSKKIHAYLKIDSISNELLKSFLEKNGLHKNKILFSNLNQSQISTLQNNNYIPMLIATSFPYNITLQKRGFNIIDSTKNIDSMVAINSLYIRKSLYNKEKERLKKLKILIDKAVEEIKINPKKVYKIVAKYFNNISYNKFQRTIKLTKWINKDRTKELNNKLKNFGYLENIL